MKKSINIRNLIIITLCSTIIFMGIGFVLLSAKLEEKNKKKDVFDISIIKVDSDTPVKGGYIAPTETKEIINEGKTVDFNFTLNAPKDELAYTITIKNKGTLPAKIIKLITIPDYINSQKQATSISPVKVNHPMIENKVLQPAEELKIKVIVTYEMSNTAVKINVPYQITILATSLN